MHTLYAASSAALYGWVQDTLPDGSGLKGAPRATRPYTVPSLCSMWHTYAWELLGAHGPGGVIDRMQSACDTQIAVMIALWILEYDAAVMQMAEMMQVCLHKDGRAYKHSSFQASQVLQDPSGASHNGMYCRPRELSDCHNRQRAEHAKEQLCMSTCQA